MPKTVASLERKLKKVEADLATAKFFIFKCVVDKPHHIGWSNDARKFIGEPPVKETVIYQKEGQISALVKQLAKEVMLRDRARADRRRLRLKLRELTQACRGCTSR